MKKIQDTFFALIGEKRYLSTQTEVLLPDPAAMGQIAKIEPSAEKNSIQKVICSQFTAGIRERLKNEFSTERIAPDAYALEVTQDEIRIYADSENAVRYGACAVRAHYDNGIREGLLYCVPNCPYRIVKVFLPSSKELPFFELFIEWCMRWGYNYIMLELGGAMEYRRHPEINTGWLEYVRRMSDYPGKNVDAQNCFDWTKDSIHIANGNGEILSQALLKEIKEKCRACGLEVIPEVPSLSHADYLLVNHPELAERADDPEPDTYCPSNPATYELLFDVLDEVIEVFEPKIVHIGHDEWYTMQVCEACKKKAAADIYAEDITKIHHYLAERGIRTMMWAEKLQNSIYDPELPHSGAAIGGAERRVYMLSTGKNVWVKGVEYPVYHVTSYVPEEQKPGLKYYHIPATYQAVEKIPQDVICMNWYYGVYAAGDRELMQNGLTCIYGNFSGWRWHRRNWLEQFRTGIQGAGVSHWSFVDRKHMQRGRYLFDLAFNSMLFWTDGYEESARGEYADEIAKELFCLQKETQPDANFVEVIHAARNTIPLRYIGDGVPIVDSDYTLGSYRILYADGTEEQIPLIWGDNIGHLQAWDEEPDEHSLQALYTCDWVRCEDMRYYRLHIPVSKTVVGFRQNIFPQYRNDVITKEVTYRQRNGECQKLQST